MHREIKEDIDRIISDLSNFINFSGKGRILVTGGAGFMGSYICECLIHAGWEVICVDDLSSGMLENVRNLLGRQNFKFIGHDVSEPLEISGKIDFVLHLASMNAPSEFEQYGVEIIKANVFGTYNMLRLANEKDAIFLFSSSSEVYGDPAVAPTPEDYRGNVNLIGVRGPYDESKRCGEALCFAFQRKHGTKVKVVRIFNTYGPMQRWDGIHGKVMAKFIVQALKNEPITIYGSGLQTRSFIYVTDTVTAILKAMIIGEALGEVINVGSTEDVTIKKLAEIVVKEVGSSSRIEYKTMPTDEPSRRQPDISKARRLLGWGPKIPLKNGIQRTARWLKTQMGQ